MIENSNYDKPPPYTPYANNDPYHPSSALPPPVMPIIIPPSVPPISTPVANYGAIIQMVPPPQVVFVGSCPACRVGILENDFTCLGIFLAIMFFPIGLLCCLALRERRCPNCGTTFQ